MKLRDIQGKRIVGIEQARFYNFHLKRFENDFHEIRLDDGTRIVFTAVETQETPSVCADVVKRGKRK